MSSVPKGRPRGVVTVTQQKTQTLSMAEFLRNAEMAVLRAQNLVDNDLAYSCEVAWVQYYWASNLKIKGTKHFNMKVAGIREMLEAKETGRVLDILRSVATGLALESVTFQ